MRRGCVLVLVAVPMLLPAAPAWAATTTVELVVDRSAWSWRPLVAVQPSNVPAGDLAVEYDGRPEAPPAKASYLHLDLSGLPGGAQASGLRLVLPLDTSVSQDATTAPVVACPLKGPIVAGEGVDPASEPAEDCSHAIAGHYDVMGQSLSFALDELASGWLAGKANDGLVIRPDPAAALPAVLPFQLTFQGPGAVTAELTAVLPEAGTVPPPAGGGAAPVPSALPHPQGGIVPLPAGPLLPTAPGLPTDSVLPAPVAAPQPIAAHPAVPVAHRTIVRTTVVRAPSRASAAGLALAAALGALLLAATGWAVGAEADVRAFARAERRRLDRLRHASVTKPVAPGVRRTGVGRQRKQSRQGRRPLASATSTVTSS